MKLLDHVGTIEKSGVTSSRVYTMAATAQSFKLISSTLYADKIRAIIREIGCNAWDAHVAAGTTDRTFDCRLPTKLNPTFCIRDYGTGLSREDIEELYSVVFLSTKNTSNSCTGAFGIGKLSIFSYTQSFTINSYFNGMQYQFAAYINSEGLPEISLLAENPTEEHNGLELSFTAKPEDIENFATVASNVFKYFTVQPRILGRELNLKPLEVPVFETKVGVKHYKYDISNSPGVVMGNVFYPLNHYSLTDLTDNQRNIIRKMLVRVNIGDVSVTASREALEYDEKTIKFLKALSGEIDAKLIKEYQEAVSTAKDKWELCIVNAKFKSSTEFNIDLTANWQGTKTTPYETQIYIPKKYITPSKKRWQNQVSITPDDDLYILVKDTKHRFAARKKFCEEVLGIEKYMVVELVSELKEHNNTFLYEGKHLINKLASDICMNPAKIIRLSSFKLPSTPRTGASKEVEVFRFDPKTGNRTVVSIDDIEEGYFAVSKYDDLYLTSEDRVADIVAQNFVRDTIQILDFDAPIYLFRFPDRKYIKDLELEDFWDEAKKQLEDVEWDYILQNQANSSFYLYSEQETLLKKLKGITSRDDIIEKCQFLLSSKSKLSNSDEQYLSLYRRIYGAIPVVDGIENTKQKTYDSIMEEYPLLRFLKTSYYDKAEQKLFDLTFNKQIELLETNCLSMIS